MCSYLLMYLILPHFFKQNMRKLQEALLLSILDFNKDYTFLEDDPSDEDENGAGLDTCDMG